LAVCGLLRYRRKAESIQHTITTPVGERLAVIALKHPDLNDHDELRHDPVMAVLAGKLWPIVAEASRIRASANTRLAPQGQVP